MDKAHGRLEVRQIRTSTALNDYLKFPHVQPVRCIHRQVTQLKTQKTTEEMVCAITSLPPDEASPQRWLELNRGHGAIENRRHYVRDVTCAEDLSQVRAQNAPQVLAGLRNLVISIFRFLNITNSAQTLRQMAAKPHVALRLLGL